MNIQVTVLQDLQWLSVHLNNDTKFTYLITAVTIVTIERSIMIKIWIICVVCRHSFCVIMIKGLV